MTKGVTLKQIRYFHALARHRHFGKAAEDCAITQPALSLQIRELEAHLGQGLVERAQGQILLTSFGRLFLQRSEAILQDVDDLCALARTGTEDPNGPVRLGMIPTIAPYILPRFLGDCASRFPALRPHLREAMTATLLHELQEGRIDAAILALPLSVPGLSEMALFSESFVLARPAADRAKPLPAPDHLQELHLLLLEDGHCFRDQALSFCKLEPRSHREILTGNSLSTLVQLVGSGIGVTLLPEMAVPLESRMAALSLSAFHPPQPARHIGMVWRKSSAMGPHLSQIAELVREIGLDLRAQCTRVLAQHAALSPVQELNNCRKGRQKILSA